MPIQLRVKISLDLPFKDAEHHMSCAGDLVSLQGTARADEIDLRLNQFGVLKTVKKIAARI